MKELIGCEDPNLEFYLSSIASNTILDGMELVYGIVTKTGNIDEIQFEMIYETEFPGFFTGIGSFFSQDDDAVGKEIIARKLIRMREKLLEKRALNSFDIFEEYIFAKLIQIIRELNSDGAYFFDEEGEKKCFNTLITKYGMEHDEAADTAREIHRVYLMGPEKSPLFFWDEDYSIIWAKGFIEGINLIKSAAGEQLGYGYEDAENIFTDIGIKAPIRLLGSKEANRLINEEEAKLMEEATESLFSDPGDIDKLLGTVADLNNAPVDEVSSSIDELLKTIPDDVLQERFGGEVPSIEEFIKYIIRSLDKHND